MTDARALKDKAAQLFTKGKFAKAAETYEEFCVLDKKDHQARLRCGDAWAKAGKKDKAIIAYSVAAEGFAKDGFLPRAIAASKLVLEIDPAHKGVQKMLAELYAQKSGGAKKAAAPAPEMEIQRNVSTPVATSFSNNKAAIDLDAPVAQKPKPQGYKPAPVEAPSPMNRADALELPEYEIPMDDAAVTTTAQGGHAVKGTTRAIAIEDSGPVETGPKALVETTIDIDIAAGQPVTGEVEIPIEGQPLPDVDQLPPELQMATPLAPAITFDLAQPPPGPQTAVPPPPPPQSFELDVPAPPPPPSAPTSGVYELTEPVPEPRPSVPVFELTEEVAEAPPPPPASPPPVVSFEEPAAAPAVVQAVVELTVPKAKVGVVDLTPAAAPPAQLDAPLHAEARFEPLDPPLELKPKQKLEPLDAPLELQPKQKLEPLDAPLDPAPKHKLEPLDAPLEAAPKPKLEPLDAPLDQPPATVSRVAAPQPPAAPRSSALPPSVGDAASAPPSIKPFAAEAAAPPGLKPRKADAAAPPAPAVPAASPSSSRIWLPPTFTPAAARTESAQPRASAAPSTPVPAASEASTDLERSLQTFMQFDPDAPVPAAAAAPPPEPVAAPAAPVAKAAASFTELDLDEGDSLLHAVEAVAVTASASAGAPAAPVEEAMEAPEDPRAEPGGLPKIPLFSDLPEDAFIALFEKCPLQRFDEGQLVFEEGDKADAFYVICGGKVRVFRAAGAERKELATLEEGSFFGEMALLSEAPRSASVEAAAEDTQVLVISAEILKELSASYPVVSTALKKFCRQRMLSNLMNQAPIFAPFNRSDRRDLVQKFRARDVGKGDVLVKEGNISDGLYVVLSGEVAVEAKGQRIATLKEGQVFGEMSLLTRTPAAATVRATRHTSLLRLPKQDFDGLILSHPQVLEHVSTLIDERKKNDLKRQKNTAELL